MSVFQARSRLAHAAKQAKKSPSPSTSAEVQAARRDLAAAKLEAYIREVVARAPALSSEQTSALATLLRGGS